MIVAEIPQSDGVIIQPDFTYDTIDTERALNRIANIAEAEQWEDWEIREAVRRVMEEGAFTEKRPAYYMGTYRRGLVVASGARMDVKIGDVILFAFGLSVNWRSFWRDAVGIAYTNRVLFTDGKSEAVEVHSDWPVHIVPEAAALCAIPYNI